MSVGRRGAHFTVGTHGTRETVGIPGTGVSYTATQGRRRPKAHHYLAGFVGLFLIYVVIHALLFGGG
jgi:hypothetical protein